MRNSAHAHTHTLSLSAFSSHSLVHVLCVFSCKEQRHNLRVAGLYSAAKKKKKTQEEMIAYMLHTYTSHIQAKRQSCAEAETVYIYTHVEMHRMCQESSLKSLCG